MCSDAACNLPLLLTRWAIEHRSACRRRYSTLVTAVYTLKLAFYILPQTTKIYDIIHRCVPLPILGTSLDARPFR